MASFWTMHQIDSRRVKMGASTNAIFGVAFLLLALFLTFLMYYLWGYPFDKKKHASTAPRSLMNLHRVLGRAFVGIYILLMWDMVPRLWTYQVELPARTVIHLTLGIAVGAILIIKIMIVRFFKHL
jgi:cbb3-type cytochrome oxidase subunit 3